RNEVAGIKFTQLLAADAPPQHPGVVDVGIRHPGIERRRRIARDELVAGMLVPEGAETLLSGGEAWRVPGTHGDNDLSDSPDACNEPRRVLRRMIGRSAPTSTASEQVYHRSKRGVTLNQQRNTRAAGVSRAPSEARRDGVAILGRSRDGLAAHLQSWRHGGRSAAGCGSPRPEPSGERQLQIHHGTN